MEGGLLDYKRTQNPAGTYTKALETSVTPRVSLLPGGPPRGPDTEEMTSC